MPALFSHPCRSLWVLLALLTARVSLAAEAVYVDPAGVIRWSADQREVALFGANYCLPSSSDYRAAGYVGADRKKLIEQDMAHFARLGWDGLRLALWGDWENCDREGNLIANDHLDLFDYLIFCAKQRGISLLFTPIHRHSALWPDGQDSDAIQGFAKFYPPSELGRNPAAIKAQQNYLRQILTHVNPYTGLALKDEPAIVFIELINEPNHHADDFAGSVSYINALADAVSGTGCKKLLFFNLSQDFRMAPAIAAARVQGFSFGWYPTGLVAGRTLTENHLRSVDHYAPLLRSEVPRLPRIVYEFDSADMNSGYMYPAMARGFRAAGAQFAAMFAYDMLATAPYNLGWQTHFMNLVYSPKKAVSAIIAGEVMRVLPPYSPTGDYPDNRRFGPFRVSYEEDLSEMVTAEKFLYANNTRTNPPAVASLRQVIGTGSSPVVDYEGNGAYFLDRLAPGIWRLEVYPDAVLVQDPFAQKINHQTVSSRLIWHEWPMTVLLPDLGGSFTVSPLNAGNRHTATASASRFTVKPGVYLLSHDPQPDRSALPQRVGQIGLAEFVCPPEPALPIQVLPVARAAYVAGQPVELAVDAICALPPHAVTLQVRPAGESAVRSFPLQAARGYRYAATLGAGTLPTGVFEYCFIVETAPGETTRHPAGAGQWLTAQLVTPAAPLTLFAPDRDASRLFFTRIGDHGRRDAFRSRPATDQDPAAVRLMCQLKIDRDPDDSIASLSIKDRVTDRRENIAAAKTLHLKARGSRAGQLIVITLVEADGTSWSAQLALTTQWQDLRVPVGEWQIDRGVLLPLGFPGQWNYWSTPAQNRGVSGDKPRLGEIERLQFSFRPAGARPIPAETGSEAWVDLASAALEFE